MDTFRVATKVTLRPSERISAGRTFKGLSGSPCFPNCSHFGYKIVADEEDSVDDGEQATVGGGGVGVGRGPKSALNWI